MSPLWWPIAGALAHFERFPEVPPVADIDRALSARAGVRFVESAPKSRRRGALDRAALYDARITLRREVPTRPGNLHDFMNALVWASFPRAKMAIHERQHALIESRIEDERLPAERTPEQDTLAMMDEGGIAIVTDRAELVERSTQARNGAGLAAQVAEGRARAAVFGHALFEHLAKRDPLKIWGRAIILRVPDRASGLAQADIDGLLAAAIAERQADHDAGSAPLLSSVLSSNAASQPELPSES